MLKAIRKFIRENQFAVLIFIFAAGLRFAHLTFLPPSLNWDEVSHGYNAYSILKTGRDEWGQMFPFIFRAYGDYKLPVYIYLTAISEAIFGLSTFAVRLPSVLAGVASVIFTYLLVRELFNNHPPYTKYPPASHTRGRFGRGQTPALLAALLVAIEPWSLFLSRGAFEANLALAFIVSGIYFFLKGIHNSKYLIHSSILLGLSVWTYNSARIFVPLFLSFLCYLYRKQLQSLFRTKKPLILNSFFIILLFLVPMFYQLSNPQGLARYGKVAILDEGAIAQINEARYSSSLSPSLRRIVYNKGTFFVVRFAKNWASHFSGSFLFFEGGSHYQFSIPGHGLLYSANAVFLIVGIFHLVRKRSKESILVLGWFILGPVASSLTREAPHVLRSITMLPAPMIITAAGVWRMIDWLKKKKLEIPLRQIVLVVYLVVLAGYLEDYLNIYAKEYRSGYSWSWQYGYEQVLNYVKENYAQYDKIVVTKKYGEPHEFFLYFWPWDPKSYQEDKDLIRFYQSDWYWVDRFDKLYFVNDWQVDEEGSGNYEFNLESGKSVQCPVDSVRCLLITSPGTVPEGWDKLETINFLDGQPAFGIYEN